MNRDAIPNDEAEKYFFHFPDGNATHRATAGSQIDPGSRFPGTSIADVVLAKANYSKLDDPASPVRIRLNSTAVRVKHLGDAAGEGSRGYVRARRQSLYREGKERDSRLLARRDSLHLRRTSCQAERSPGSAQKVPLLYTNVAIRNWTAFQKFGANSIYAPGMYHTF